jgi:hypothetical protein
MNAGECEQFVVGCCSLLRRRVQRVEQSGAGRSVRNAEREKQPSTLHSDTRSEMRSGEVDVCTARLSSTMVVTMRRRGGDAARRG